MATSRSGDVNRKSYILSVQPVNLSLTDGTNIPPPPPPEQTVRQPVLQAEATTASANDVTSQPPLAATAKQDGQASASSPDKDGIRSPSSSGPYSPTSSPYESRRMRRNSVRRLVSLSNLRSSFSVSRTNFSLGPASGDMDSVYGVKRPSSPGNASTAPSTMSRFSLRRSGNWFKRRNSMYGVQEDGTYGSPDQNDRPGTRASKRLKESTRPPMLPSISELAGGEMDEGLGWDDRLFKK